MAGNIKRKYKRRGAGFFNVDISAKYSDDSEDSDYNPHNAIPGENALPMIPVLKIATNPMRLVKHSGGKCSSGKKRRKHGKDVAHSESVQNESGVFDSIAAQLPDVCLLNIFNFTIAAEGTASFLYRIPRVCSRWNEISKDPSLYRYVDLSTELRKYNESSLVTFFKERAWNVVRHLNLSGYANKLSRQALPNIIRSCPHVTHINLSGCANLRAEHMRLLVDGCPRLKSLEVARLSSAGTSEGALSSQSMKYIVDKCGGNLTQLNISNNRNVKVSALLVDIGEKCGSLRVLDISNIHLTEVRCIFNVESLQKGCPKLQVLRIANTRLKLAPVPLFEQAGSPGFPNLEELSIAVVGNFGTSRLSDGCLERILKTSHKLKLLDVRGCVSISSSSLVRLQAWNLEHLFLSKCNATIMLEGLDLVMQKWAHSLKEVDLSWNSDIFGKAINSAVSALAAAAKESVLHSLYLSGTAISYPVIKNLLLNCSKLAVLDLSSCRGLPRGMKRKFEGLALQQLKINILSNEYNALDED